jgi:hypothetical protein
MLQTTPGRGVPEVTLDGDTKVVLLVAGLIFL